MLAVIFRFLSASDRIIGKAKKPKAYFALERVTILFLAEDYRRVRITCQMCTDIGVVTLKEELRNFCAAERRTNDLIREVDVR